MPKVGIKLLLISYPLPESFALASASFIALMNPFDPYSLLNFQLFIILFVDFSYSKAIEVCSNYLSLTSYIVKYPPPKLCFIAIQYCNCPSYYTHTATSLSTQISL